MNNVRKLNREEVIDIIRKSHPIEKEQDKSGSGYWLFEKKLKSDIKGYFSYSSEWYPVIFLGLFDEYSDKCIAMLCYTNHCSNSFEKYPYVLIVQGVENKAGFKLLTYLMKTLKKDGEKGIALAAINDEVAKLYEKKGFIVYSEKDGIKRLQYTFPSNVNDSVFEEIINENYLSGAYGDPTYSVGTPNTRYTTGYMYSIKALNSNLSGQKQKVQGGIQYIHVGSLISSTDKDGNLVSGRVYKIEKDSDGFIKKVWIFGDNAKLINVSLKNIISIGSDSVMFDDNEMNKYKLGESVKAGGVMKTVSYKDKRYILTLNEGEVVVGEMKNGKLVSLKSVYNIDESLAEGLLNKITK